MEAVDTAQILKELSGAERRSLAVRLLESTVFVSPLGVGDLHLVKRLAAHSKERCAEMAALIIELGEAPALYTRDPMSADLHYMELGHAMPRLLAHEEALLGLYCRAARRLEPDSPAGAFVIRACKELRQDRPGDNRALGV